MKRRPKLTDAEKNLIAFWRGTRGWSHKRIAKALDRAIGSVSWYCLQDGIEKPRVAPIRRQRRAAIVKRGNHLVRCFSEPEDQMMTALRLAGKTPTEIARQLGRRPNSITGRLMTLARHEARGLQ